MNRNDKPIPRLSYHQYRTMRRLVHECCNNFESNCLLLDHGEECVCVQSISLQEIENQANEDSYRRIYDRVIDMCVPIRFVGESKRRINAESKLHTAKEILK